MDGSAGQKREVMALSLLAVFGLAFRGNEGCTACRSEALTVVYCSGFGTMLVLAGKLHWT